MDIATQRQRPSQAVDTPCEISSAQNDKENNDEQLTASKFVSGLKRDTVSGFHMDSNSHNIAGRKSSASPSPFMSNTEPHVNWSAVLASLQAEKRLAIARREEHYINRSLFLFASSSKPREWAIKLVEWPVFDKLVLFLIAFNCVLLTFDDPICRCASNPCSGYDLYQQALYNHDCSSWPKTALVLQYAEIIFTVIFSAEMMTKILARGFVLHMHAYLRDPWNWIDFIVVASLISFAPGVNISILRTFRVLRPLRTLSRLKYMKSLLITFAKSFQSICNVFALLGFFMLLFSILAIELFSGSLRGYCYFDPRPGRNSFTPAAYSRLLSQQTPFIAEQWNILGAWNVYVQTCRADSITVFGPSSGFACPPLAIDGIVYNTTCSTKKWCGTDWCQNAPNSNPLDDGWGYISYDNIFSALITVFQSLTFSAWSDILYRVANGSNIWIARIFSSSWILVGSFVVVQLALAVLSEAFERAQEEQKTEKEREALGEESILKIYETESNLFHTDGLTRRTRSVNTFSILPKRLSVLLQSRTTRIFQGEPQEASTQERMVEWFKSRLSSCTWVQSSWTAIVKVAIAIVNNVWFHRTTFSMTVLNAVCLGLEYHDQELFETSICRSRCKLDPWMPAGAVSNCVGPLFNRSFSDDGTGTGFRPPQELFCFLDNDGDIVFPGGNLYSGSNCSSYDTMMACTNDSRCGWIGKKCKRGLYNITNFAESAVRTSSNPPVISRIYFRDLCGDSSTQPAMCPNFPVELSVSLDAANYIFTGVFFIELILKLFALGIYRIENDKPAGYFADGFHWLDFPIVVASTIDAILSLTISSSNSAFSSLRALRILRMLRLAKSWKGLQKVLASLASSLKSLGPLCIMIALFLYVFALLGMQLFGATFQYVKTDVPRSNFNSFFPSETGHGAFLAIFQMISLENWNNIMYCAMTGDSMTPVSSLFFICVLLFGNYMLMNLFTSILLQGIEQSALENPKNSDEKPNGGTKPLKAVLAFLEGKMGMIPDSDYAVHPAEIDASTQTNRVEHSDLTVENRLSCTFGRGFSVKISNHNSLFLFWPANPLRLAAAVVIRSKTVENIILLLIIASSLSLMIEDPADVMVSSDVNCPPPPLFLNCSGPAAIIGQVAQINCPRSPDDNMFGLVFAPCNAGGDGTAIMPPCCSVKQKMEVLDKLNEIFTIVFFIEMMLKIIADGLILHPLAYLRDRWNWLDFTIVIISMLSTFGSSTGSVFKVLRTLRALRPLRVIKRNPGLKVVVSALLSSLPAMGSVCLVVMFWLSMYSILGVQLFKGAFYKCYDYSTQFFPGATIFPLSNNLFSPTAKLSGPGSVPTIIECVNAEQANQFTVWTNRPFCFDHIFRAMLCLFEMMTTSGWMEMLQSMVDATRVGVTPTPNANPWVAFYGFGQLFMGNFILINLVVGTVLSTYIRMKQQNEGISPFMTEEQHQWREVQNLMTLMKPKQRAPEHTSAIRKKLFRFVESRIFDIFVRILVFITIISQVIKAYGQPASFTVALFWINTVVTALYFFEAGCKLVAFGWQFYISSRLNLFDLSLCAISLARLILDVGQGEYDVVRVATRQDSAAGMAQKFCHALSAVRAFRLLRFTKGLREMIKTIIVSGPAIANIGTIVILICLIYAILGWSLFYNVNLAQDPYQRMGAYGVAYASYTTFDDSLWIIHRMTTNDFWNGIMYYCAGMFMEDDYERCDKTFGDYLGNGCGDIPTSVVFHVTWIIFGTYVMMQLFAAIILENYIELVESNRVAVPKDILDELVNVWAYLDPYAKGSISVQDLPLLVMNTRAPLGVRVLGKYRDGRLTGIKDNTSAEYQRLRRSAARDSSVLRVIRGLKIPLLSGRRITYKDTILCCVKRAVIDSEDNVDSNADSGDAATQNQANSQQKQADPCDESIKDLQGRSYTAADEFAARYSLDRADSIFGLPRISNPGTQRHAYDKTDTAFTRGLYRRLLMEALLRAGTGFQLPC